MCRFRYIIKIYIVTLLYFIIQNEYIIGEGYALDKGVVIFSSLIIRTIIFVFISFVINLSVLKKIKNTNAIKNLIFGVQITLIGISSLYIIWDYKFYSSIFWSQVMWFIPIYLITTGFTFGLTGYLDKNNN